MVILMADSNSHTDVMTFSPFYVSISEINIIFLAVTIANAKFMQCKLVSVWYMLMKNAVSLRSMVFTMNASGSMGMPMRGGIALMFLTTLPCQQL